MISLKSGFFIQFFVDHNFHPKSEFSEISKNSSKEEMVTKLVPRGFGRSTGRVLIDPVKCLIF